MKVEHITAVSMLIVSFVVAILIQSNMLRFEAISINNSSNIKTNYDVDISHPIFKHLKDKQIYNYQVLSYTQPVLILFNNFLTETEIDHLKMIYKSEKKYFEGRTAVVTGDGYGEVLPNTVTSTIMRTDIKRYSQVFPEQYVETVKRVNQKISDATGIPVNNAEPLTYIHYYPNQYFTAHLDAHLRLGRPTSTRVATMFLYLNDDFEGGETFFPLARRANSTQPDKIPDNCKGHGQKDPKRQPKSERDAYFDGSEDGFNPGQGDGIVIKPIKGSALFWVNLHSNGTCDVTSRHGGCPVIGKGEKLGMSKWMYNHPWPDPSKGQR